MAEEVIIRGPVFDGRAEAATQSFCRETERVISNEAVARIRDFLPTQYKYLGHSGGDPQDNPEPDGAGFYVSQIHAEASAEGYRVIDSDVVYGPWLEGVSERNQATRFPGYGAFRKIGQEIDTVALPMANSVFPPYIAAMNGV